MRELSPTKTPEHTSAPPPSPPSPSTRPPPLPTESLPRLVLYPAPTLAPRGEPFTPLPAPARVAGLPTGPDVNPVVVESTPPVRLPPPFTLEPRPGDDVHEPVWLSDRLRALDREQLSEALADLLREEARREGVEV